MPVMPIMRRTLNLRFLLQVAGTLILTGTVVHFAHSFQIHRQAGSILDRADVARKAGDVDQAAKYYRHYLGREPDDGAAWAELAIVLDSRASQPSEWAEVAELCRQVLQRDKDRQELRRRLVYNLIRLHRFREAIANIEVLLPNAEDKAALEHMLGWCREAGQDYEKAAAAFQRAIGLDPNRVESYVLLAEVLHKHLNRPEEAERVIEKLVAANPGSFRAYMTRYQYRRSQAVAGADADLQRALALAPREPAVLMAAAERAQAKGDLAAARSWLGQCWEVEPNNADLAKTLVGLELRTGHSAEAIAILAAAIKAQPQSWELSVLLADILVGEGKQTDAAARIDELKESEAPPALVDYLLARLAAAQGQWSIALKLLERVVPQLAANSGWAAQVHALLGQCHESLGDYDKALSGYLRALELGDRQPSHLARLARLLIYFHRSMDAEQFLHQIKEPLPPELMRLGAEIALANQSTEEALRLARQSVQSTRGDYRDYLWQGRICHDAGADQEADDSLRQAVTLAPQTPETWTALVEQWTRTGKRELARLALAEAALAVGPRLSLFTQARCLEVMGLVGEAESFYEQAVAESPQDFVVLENAARFYLQTDQPEKAEPMLEALLRLGEAVPEEHSRRARRQLALILAGRTADERGRALTLIDENLLQRPNNPADIRAGALVKATDAARRREAIRVFEHTAKRQPLAPAELYQLARLQGAVGDTFRAREALTQLVSSQPENTQFLAQYVRHLLNTEEIEQARKEFLRLEALEPGSTRTLALKERIAERP